MKVLPNAGIPTTTDEIINSKFGMLHLLPDPSDCFVSSSSKWMDPVWRLDGGPKLNWAYQLSGGSSLLERRYATLLDAFRRLIWTRLADPVARNAISPRTAYGALSQCRPLIGWMVATFRLDFAHLDSEAFREFTDDWISRAESSENFDETLELDALSEEAQPSHDAPAASNAASSSNQCDDDQRNSGLRHSPLYGTISAWRQIWLQTEVLQNSHIPVMREDPLEGRTPLSVTNKIVALVLKRIPPLPDEVALPVMNQAHRWLDVRADDVIRLHLSCMSAIEKSRRHGSTLDIAEKKLFPTFHFSVEPGETKPWHEPLQVYRASTKSQGEQLYLPVDATRQLVEAVVGAAIIVIESESGVRPAEIQSLRAGVLPKMEKRAYHVELSLDGLNELFFLTGMKSKGLKAPEPKKWLAGSRPTGSPFIPGPIKAIDVLEKLLAPWRELAVGDDQERLFVHKAKANLLPTKTAGVVATSTYGLLSTQRDFIESYVDLSGLPDKGSLDEDLTSYRKKKGRNLITAQWRKTYAMYMVRTDSRMIPAVSTQFDHLSVTMTESAYIGDNIELLRERNSQQARAAAAFMYRMVVGKEPAAGRIAKLIEANQHLILNAIGSEKGPVGLRRLQEWCEDRGIKMFDSKYGGCFIGLMPTEARCHEIAQTISWHNRQPNYETREPELCSGCKCFGVDTEHSEFWKNRYIENQTSWLSAKARGLERGFRVMQERAQTSAKMLGVLGIALPAISGENDA